MSVETLHVFQNWLSQVKILKLSITSKKFWNCLSRFWNCLAWKRRTNGFLFTPALQICCCGVHWQTFGGVSSVIYFIFTHFIFTEKPSHEQSNGLVTSVEDGRQFLAEDLISTLATRTLSADFREDSILTFSVTCYLCQFQVHVWMKLPGRSKEGKLR